MRAAAERPPLPGITRALSRAACVAAMSILSATWVEAKEPRGFFDDLIPAKQAAAPASDGPIETGADLVDWCMAAYAYVESGSTNAALAPKAFGCSYYIRGFLEAFTEADEHYADGKTSPLFCPPPGNVTPRHLANQLAGAWIAFPETMNAPASRLLAALMAREFPCSQTSLR